MKLLEDQIAELLAKAEDADSTPLQDGLSIPAEIARREERIEKLKQATAVIEARAAERCREETDIHQQKLEDRERKQRRIPALGSISTAAGQIGTALVDSGYYSAAAVTQVETGGGPQVLAATGRKKHGRTIAELEQREDPPAPPAGAEIAEVMAWRTSTAAGKELYGLRKETVEPVFGIIKEALGFRRFHLRGLGKVDLESTLVRLAYNIKRLYHISQSKQTAVA